MTTQNSNAPDSRLFLSRAARGFLVTGILCGVIAALLYWELHSAWSLAFAFLFGLGASQALTLNYALRRLDVTVRSVKS